MIRVVAMAVLLILAPGRTGLVYQDCPDSTDAGLESCTAGWTSWPGDEVAFTEVED